MGVCGCGDFYGDYKFPGPGDITYVLQIYPSCNICHRPAGVVLYKFNPENVKQWDVEEIPDLEISNIGTGIGVIDPNILKRHMGEIFKGWAAEMANDGVSEFRDAVFDTIKSNPF